MRTSIARAALPITNLASVGSFSYGLAAVAGQCTSLPISAKAGLALVVTGSGSKAMYDCIDVWTGADVPLLRQTLFFANGPGFALLLLAVLATICGISAPQLLELLLAGVCTCAAAAALRDYRERGDEKVKAKYRNVGGMGQMLMLLVLLCRAAVRARWAAAAGAALSMGVAVAFVAMAAKHPPGTPFSVQQQYVERVLGITSGLALLAAADGL